jgi:hypothetical protein
VASVVAMDILSEYDVGGDVAIVSSNMEKWKKLALEEPLVNDVLKEANAVTALLPRLAEIHLQRCMLEVNPLGFAVSCTPIHPPREKIDLNWTAETRDGLLLDLALTRCRGSSSCKALKKVSREFLQLYLRTLDNVEDLTVGVFRDQLREWLKLPPFGENQT